MSAAATTIDPIQAYINHVNPQWARLLSLVQMQADYGLCWGAELHTAGGDVILDFQSGSCVHNAGHNHPAIIEALYAELDRRGPVKFESHVPDLAGEPARRLCQPAKGKLEKAFFALSASDGVEAAIKFARATTERAGILFCGGAFHGLPCGALSLVSDESWRGKFGPMLANTASVPFGGIAALEEKLKSRVYAAFMVEPAESEAGTAPPIEGYLRQAKQFVFKLRYLARSRRSPDGYVPDRPLPGRASLECGAGYGHPGRGAPAAGWCP
jgi:ornithine--oxo-acid transaminase